MLAQDFVSLFERVLGLEEIEWDDLPEGSQQFVHNYFYDADRRAFAGVEGGFGIPKESWYFEYDELIGRKLDYPYIAPPDQEHVPFIIKSNFRYIVCFLRILPRFDIMTGQRVTEYEHEVFSLDKFAFTESSADPKFHHMLEDAKLFAETEKEYLQTVKRIGGEKHYDVLDI